MSTGRPPTPADVAAARALLDVKADAGRDDILAAWKRQVRLHHPDTADPAARHTAEARTKQLNAAKSLLVTALELGVAAPRPTSPPRSTVPGRVAPPVVRVSGRPPSTVHRPVGEAVTPLGNRWLWLLGLSGLALAAVFLIATISVPTGRSRIGTDAATDVVAPSTTLGLPPPVPVHGGAVPTPATASLLAEPEAAAALLLEAAVERDYLAQRVVVDSSAVYAQVQEWWTRVGNTDLDGADVDLARSALNCTRQAGAERARCSFPTPLLVNLPALELVYRMDAGWQVVGTAT